jgi:hypothetical protein
MTADMSEAALQRMVIDLAKYSGYMYWHCVDPRKSQRGFPDLVLCHVHTGRLLLIELKTDVGKVRPEQAVWLKHLGIRHEAYVLRPADWHSGRIRDLLTNEPQELAA